jgi:asparagine synthase (glutamine-hydrolysing)
VCGIFFSESNLLNSSQISLIGEYLNHRGPDAQGILKNSEIGITAIHSRLAIQDLDPRSNQPFFSSDGSAFIIYNGEIFNKSELSRQLKGRVNLRTTSDTEVLIEMIQLYGIDSTLPKIKGMFAFVFVDLKANRILAARDRFGIKPLYFSLHNLYGMIFVSEIEALRPLTSLTVNHSILRDFVYFGLLDHSEETFYENVFRVPAGGIVEKHEGQWIHRMWQDESSNQVSEKLDYTDYIEKLDLALKKEVNSSTISDCSIGLNLSSGVDSQLIYRYLAPMHTQLQLHTVSWTDSEYSELNLVRSSVRSGDQLNEHIFSAAQVWNLVESSFKVHNEPFTSPFVAVWNEVYRRIHNTGVKVVLDGSGADELFFGYSKYQNWQRQEFWRLNIDGSSNNLSLKPKYQYSSKSLLESNTLDIKYLKLPRSLRFIDKASMFNSVETRVPFLSSEILSIARSAPIDWHIDSQNTKKTLRECLRRNSGLKPFAPKWNTQIPLHDWMRTSWHDSLTNLFSDATGPSLCALWQYEIKPLRNAVEELKAKRITDKNLIWRMAIASLWIRSQSSR